MLKRSIGVSGAVLFSTFIAPPAARADEVLLKNGDRLTGKITSLADGKITINLPAAGDVKIDLKQVATYQTDGPIAVKLGDGQLVQRKVTAADPGRVRLDDKEMGNNPVPIDYVKQINPPTYPIYSGSIAAGALLTRGNTQTDSLNLAAHLERRGERDKFAIGGTYIYGRSHDRDTGQTETTAENWQTEARYDYEFTPKFYGFADAQISKDRVARLQLRVAPSVGVGYKFVQQPDFTFATEGGLAWVYERFTNNTPVREDVSLRLAYHATKKFNDTFSVYHDMEYFPSLETGRHYIVNTDLGLRANLTKHLFTEAKIVLDFDSAPANGALKTNTTYLVNVGYNF